jgi:hypothetical protein
VTRAPERNSTALRRPVLSRRPHVIVLGNEKGGSGKSTTAMHVIVALLNDGWTVASLDLDARQGTLSRYIENRLATSKEMELPMPLHRRLARSNVDSVVAQRADEAERFATTLAEFADVDFVVIDTPGSDTILAAWPARADTLVANERQFARFDLPRGSTSRARRSWSVDSCGDGPEQKKCAHWPTARSTGSCCATGFRTSMPATSGASANCSRICRNASAFGSHRACPSA